MSRVLVIDDDRYVRQLLEVLLQTAGYSVAMAETAERGLDLGRSGTFDVIILDVRLPGMSGIDLLRKLRGLDVDTGVVVLTGFATIEDAVEAMKLGAAEYLQKPFPPEELLLRVAGLVKLRPVAQDARLRQRPVPGRVPNGVIVGTSQVLERARTFIRRVGTVAGTVLITGDTGTGKELVARAIHAASPRAAGPFVAVNCAALTESLLEAELFGHTRGAFTGAIRDRPGLIEHARAGTLFLDEIGAMPRSLQAKLLRVLESQEVRRLGENEVRGVDVRFIAATNSDLKAATATGEFRADLYYRLNVLRVHLPPLRERKEDLPELVQHFLRRYGATVGMTRVSKEAMDVLLAYDYPGNIRELEHIVQWAVAFSGGDAIEVGDLPEDVVQPYVGQVGIGVAGARIQAERGRIFAALVRHGGNLEKVAEELGVSRTTLWRLRRRHGVDGEHV